MAPIFGVVDTEGASTGSGTGSTGTIVGLGFGRVQRRLVWS